METTSKARKCSIVKAEPFSNVVKKEVLASWDEVKFFNRIILELLKVAVDEKPRDQQAGFWHATSCTVKHFLTG